MGAVQAPACLSEKLGRAPNCIDRRAKVHGGLSISSIVLSLAYSPIPGGQILHSDRAKTLSAALTKYYQMLVSNCPAVDRCPNSGGEVLTLDAVLHRTGLLFGDRTAFIEDHRNQTWKGAYRPRRSHRKTHLERLGIGAIR